MAVIEYDPIRLSSRDWRLRWTSTLGGTPTYKIYRNGSLIKTTTDTTLDVFVDIGSRIHFDIRDDDEVPSVTHEATARIWWYGVQDASYYTVSQRKDGGAWSDIAVVQECGSSRYRIETEELTAGSTYNWKIIATDVNGNETSEPIELTKQIDRAPNSPDWSTSWDSETGELTITV